MKNFFKTIINNPHSLVIKISLLALFILIFTGSDLIVKQIAYLKLRDKPDVIVIPDYLQFHYIINDDVGFSLFRFIDGFFKPPQKIKANKFQTAVLDKIENIYYKNLIEKFYILSEKGDYYMLDKNITRGNQEYVKDILSSLGYRTSKWLFLSILQCFGTSIVISFFLYSNIWRYLLPLGLISSGALGNAMDRVIRGYVVDYVQGSLSFIPKNFGFFYRLFNPWPIFNLADVYTVTGALFLFVIITFFTKEIVIHLPKTCSAIPFFELIDYHINSIIIKTKTYNDFNSIANKFNSNKIEFLALNFLEGMEIYKKNKNLKLITCPVWQEYSLLVNDPKIVKIKDLSGKIIIIPENNMACDMQLNMLLKNERLSKRIKIIYAPLSSAVKQFENKAVHAICLSEPNSSKFILRNKAYKIFSFNEKWKEINGNKMTPQLCLFTNKHYAEKKDFILKLINILNKTIIKINEQPAVYAERYQFLFNLNEDFLENSINNVHFEILPFTLFLNNSLEYLERLESENKSQDKINDEFFIEY